MREAVRTSLLMLLLMTVLTGALYPLAVTGLAEVLFPGRSQGSLLVKDGSIVGSELVGQSFSDPPYFWGRPSATFPPYNAGASAGSNLGPTNPVLEDTLRARIARLKAADPGNDTPIPVDLVTASGSGLDPHISPAAALYQVPRIARLRGLDEGAVRALVQRHIEGRQLGILGEPRVNVLRLNVALDGLRGPS